MSNGVVKVGERVPDFTLHASNGKDISLSDYKGKKLVIYFYPKDMTPGCTAESCDFRDFNGEFAANQAEVVGISPDDLTSHEQFVSEYKLPFLLLSDTDHKVSELFGVWKELSWGGKTFLGVERSTFIINEEGTLVREWRSVSVDGHAAEVLKAVKA
ncbi:thioredoxin-dependent thiol peroxidase [Paenibacillus sp. 1011MAR3C5]|uniref:thioredoxin-dependent thiol peroxidase n=1 Tax=Paenibacillus sp. 1011MAR3C5 TaxID=1675787 RepID=UPI000E6B6400|nr:thioredoxin-dependent thiol peroxidase [Paenibacillus sp. 1011MAR3C5]RJE86040.1 thioredoxin-dependent thiol peroxidase [Paenibacillus sp. 1011MAR3C5]